MWQAHTCYIDLSGIHVSTLCVSAPPLQGSALQCFERGNVVKLRYGIMFDFCLGLPHMPLANVIEGQ